MQQEKAAFERFVHERGLRMTRARLAVLEEMKGGGERTFDVRIPGGEAEGVRTVVAGMPKFRSGQEAVLFLKRAKPVGAPARTSASTQWVVSLAHRGHVPIHKDKSGERRLSGFVTGFRALAPVRTGLDEFRTAVRYELKRLSAARKTLRSK